MDSHFFYFVVCYGVWLLGVWIRLTWMSGLSLFAYCLRYLRPYWVMVLNEMLAVGSMEALAALMPYHRIIFHLSVPFSMWGESDETRFQVNGSVPPGRFPFFAFGIGSKFVSLHGSFICLLSELYSIKAMKWRNLHMNIESAAALMTSIRSSDWWCRVVWPGECLDSTILHGGVTVKQLT